MRRNGSTLACLLCAVLVFSEVAFYGVGGMAASAQQISPHGSGGAPFTTTATNLIIPQSRAYAVRREEDRVRIEGVTASVQILQQVATTTMTVALRNTSERQQEAEMLVPVPDGAVVRSFDFGGGAKEPTARLLPKSEAKGIYYKIVSQLRDPALLEFAGYNLVRSSVFPVPARGTQTVKLVYENILGSDGARVDYVLPRSESFEAAETPWKISVRIQSKTPISTVYSPSHTIESERVAPNQLVARTPQDAKLDPGSFRLSYLVEGSELAASLLAYPDPTIGGGYFLLLAGVPATVEQKRSTLKREVTLVIDRSGSMEGEKIKQARAAALQVVEGLEEGEAFNIIDYSEAVAKFSERPVIKTAATLSEARSYIKRIKSGGGTNIRDALVEALSQPPVEGMLPLTLFLTDGLPTVGETREAAIRKSVIDANAHKRRIFTFGVGYDVNAPLLSSIASATRAATTFVFPNEDVEQKVAQVFRRLSGPVLADPQLSMLDASGEVTPQAVRELLPAQLGDVFEGDQIVLLGQYQSPGPLTFRIDGNYFGTPRSFRFTFDLQQASTRNSFVPRLWASRKIARLVEAISELGADTSTASAGRLTPMSSNRVPVTASGGITAAALPAAPGVVVAAVDPRVKELVDEIVRLSTEFGILTEYTAFLATDGTDFSRRDEVSRQAQDNFVRSAQGVRSGMGGITQVSNMTAQKSQGQLNRSNTFISQANQRVEMTNVQQITDRTFFRRGTRWVDARLLEREKSVTPDQTVEFGTPAFYALVERLVAEGRQGILALSGEMLLMVDGKTVLIKGSKQ